MENFQIDEELDVSCTWSYQTQTDIEKLIYMAVIWGNHQPTDNEEEEVEYLTMLLIIIILIIFLELHHYH